MASGDYCTIADVLLSVSPDSQARLSTEAGRPVVLGVATSTPQTTWPTPFIGATKLDGYFNGTLQAGTTISVGTGPGGTDQIIFATAPSAGVGVTASADALAINSAVVALAITAASGEIDQYIGGRYQTPVTDPLTLRQLWGVTIKGVRWLLRQRRSMEEWSPIAEDRKAVVRWLELVAKGQIPLAASATEAAPAVPATPAFSGSERSVFDPPFTGGETSPLLWP
jgi:phage gp36-like protein